MMNQGGKSVRNRGSQASSNLISLGYTAPISFYYHHPTFVIKYFRWDPVKIWVDFIEYTSNHFKRASIV